MKVRSKRNVVGFVSLLLLILLIGITSVYIINKKNEANRWVTQTYEVIANLEELSYKLKGAESAARAFMISGEDNQLNDYNTFLKITDEEIQEIGALIENDSIQIERFDQLKQLIDERFRDLSFKIDHRSKVKKVDSLLVSTVSNGSFIMLKVQNLSSQIKSDEHTLLVKRSTEAARINVVAICIIAIGSLVSILTVLLLIINITRLFDQQKRVEINLKRSNIELERLNSNEQRRNWILSGKSQLSSSLHKHLALEELCQAALKEICNYAGFQLGALYVVKEEKKLVLAGCCGFFPEKVVFHFNEGLPGQAAAEKRDILLTEMPSNYFKVQSATGEAAPSWTFILPLHVDSVVFGVLEVSGIQQLQPQQRAFLEEIRIDLALTIQAVTEKQKVEKLNLELQTKSVQLLKQQEELKAINEELLSNTDALQQSEEELKVQSMELQSMNTMLEEKAQLLNDKNIELERSRQKVEEASKYKSEFLANMSHELRTPLNSILILARLLQENKQNTLTEKQQEYARVIQKAGNDLLLLINDVLDLSKIEAGRMEVEAEDIVVAELIQNLKGLFSVVAEEKEILFTSDIDPAVPSKIESDHQKLEQILRNLLSNAFKFTPEKGRIKMNVLLSHENPVTKEKGSGENWVVFEIEDTGIGIAEDKQQVIFEAFRQADGSINRKFGGTGLGLSISLHFARMLGGHLLLRSTTGKGTCFSVCLPLKKTAAPKALSASAKPVADAQAKAVLVIEDDKVQARFLCEKIHAADGGMQCVHAVNLADAFEKTESREFDVLVIDLHLPQRVNTQNILDLKNSNKRHDALIVINSGLDLSEEEERGFKAVSNAIVLKGERADERIIQLINYHFKVRNDKKQQPVVRTLPISEKNILENKTALIADDDMRNVFTLSALLKEAGMEVIAASDGKQALEKLSKFPEIDIVLTDIMMPEMDGYEVIKKIRAQHRLKALPVIAVTAKAMKDERKRCIEAGATDYVSKPIDNRQLIQLIKMHLYNDAINTASTK